MTFAKHILALLLAVNCYGQFIPRIGHTAGATNVTLVKMLPELTLTNGLVAYWRFESGALTNDSWGTNTLTTAGATPPTSASGGFVGNCATNTSTTGYMGAVSNNFVGTTFSVSAWVLARDYSNMYDWAGQYGASGSRKWKFQIGSPQGLRAMYSANGTSETPIAGIAAASLVAGKWYHVVLVSGGGTISLYADGILRTSTSATIYDAAIGLGLMSGDNAATGLELRGAIDEVMYWNRELTANEVRLLSSTNNWRNWPLRYR
jgi:hypothetical protein